MEQKPITAIVATKIADDLDVASCYDNSTGMLLHADAWTLKRTSGN